jgi:L-threonylcarbamoyladenylate synthase
VDKRWDELLCDPERAAKLLRAGMLVAVPTETVYGLAADATNPVAVARIFAAKNRPTFDPLIVHVPSINSLPDLVQDVPDTARRLAEAVWPGPLTIVLPKRDIIPDLVTSGLPGVGVRVPRHPLTLDILKRAGCPLAAPSANPFGAISPTTAQHVLEGLGGVIDGVVDGGPCAVGLESTVVSFMADTPVVLRPGGLPIEFIESVIGPVQRATADAARDDAAQPAPGMLSRHYAPRTRLQLLTSDATAFVAATARCGLLTWGAHDLTSPAAMVINLSPTGDLTACAAGFFAALRELDAADCDVIFARRFPACGLGVALNDRLQRAAEP